MAKRRFTAQLTKQHIITLTEDLIKLNLTRDQCYPELNPLKNDTVEVAVPYSSQIGVISRKEDYIEMYDNVIARRAFNILLHDGGIIYMMYEFCEDVISRHRLMFIQSPISPSDQSDHPPDQSDDEFDYHDVEYSDVVRQLVIPFTMRFDFDVGNRDKIDHPMSHLTLSNFQSCRIPVTEPLSPFSFTDFIIRNFYNKPSDKYSERLTAFRARFDETIRREEQSVIHLVVPRRT